MASVWLPAALNAGKAAARGRLRPEIRPEGTQQPPDGGAIQRRMVMVTGKGALREPVGLARVGAGRDDGAALLNGLDQRQVGSDTPGNAKWMASPPCLTVAAMCAFPGEEKLGALRSAAQGVLYRWQRVERAGNVRGGGIGGIGPVEHLAVLQGVDDLARKRSDFHIGAADERQDRRGGAQTGLHLAERGADCIAYRGERGVEPFLKIKKHTSGIDTR
jgi:hypothetical protein